MSPSLTGSVHAADVDQPAVLDAVQQHAARQRRGVVQTQHELDERPIPLHLGERGA